MGANDIIGDGKEAWFYVPAGGVANIAAPTVLEITSGIRISQWMTIDGATGFAPETAAAATSGIEDRTDTSIPGRVTFSNMMFRFRAQQGTDVARATLTYDTRGFVYRRKSILATTPVSAGQKMRGFYVAFGEQVDMDYEQNMPERWQVPLFPAGTQNVLATVV
ncbi:phage tail tube protein [Actinoplanes siamensis]|uniref:Uncharacterized protein n=1 Tax=Actinoplanes siamensis TaxID=1223317 RepID=A0A919NDK6_9ACTN|nr:hypothetical protein [Actinoplanes siamensis]GIF08655.1 hypothetical protein Asi03nite_61930 [Actinoplanes siamensis]